MICWECLNAEAEYRYCGSWVGFDTILHCYLFPETAQGIGFDVACSMQ